MTEKTLILTSSGLKNLVIGSSLEQDFSFIFSDQKVNMKNVYAEFISPSVSKLHQSDPTINSIYFTDKHNDISFTQSILSKFKLIACGESVTISEEESYQLKIISILIDNKDLFSKLDDLYCQEIDESNIDQYLTNLTIISQISQTTGFFNYCNIIDFISSHFYSIDKEKLKKLPKTVIYSIISNSNLKLQSEDSLFDFITELFENNDQNNIEIIQFYEKVEFDKLSEEKFDQFLEMFNPFDITHELWSKLVLCFYNNKSKPSQNKQENRYFYDEMKIEFDGNPSHSLAGIISYLTRLSGGNVAKNGTVNVSSSSHYSNRVDSNAVELENDKIYFQTDNIKDSWLKYDFVGRGVHPTHYSIRTRPDYDGYHPRNWVIEGSNDDNDWEILDTRQNDSSLNGRSSTHTFDIEEHEGSYRYLRFRQTGCNSSSESNFCTALSALEYFGTLIENNK